MLEEKKAHRAHAIIEQVIADLKGGPLAHLPSGKFWANSAWLVCAAMAFNLTRTAGVLASRCHDRHDPGAPDQHPRPARTLRPPLHAAPADQMALASNCSGPAGYGLAPTAGTQG